MPVTPFVALATPMYGYVSVETEAYFGDWLSKSVASGEIRSTNFLAGAYVDHARNELVRMVRELSSKATHIFFRDQDVLPPLGTIRRLLSLDVPVVGGVYFTKDENHFPVAFDDPDGELYLGAKRGTRNPDYHLLSVFDPTGPQPVDGVGMGCTLIQMEVFQKLEDFFKDQIWFRDDECGEDVHFFRRCRRIGIQPLLDGCTISGHARDEIVTLAHYLGARQRDRED